MSPVRPGEDVSELAVVEDAIVLPAGLVASTAVPPAAAVPPAKQPAGFAAALRTALGLEAKAQHPAGDEGGGSGIDAEMETELRALFQKADRDHTKGASATKPDHPPSSVARVAMKPRACRDGLSAPQAIPC